MSHKAVKRECADIFELSRQRETNFSQRSKEQFIRRKARTLRHIIPVSGKDDILGPYQGICKLFSILKSCDYLCSFK